MKITVIPGKELAAEHVAAWIAIQQADPALDSPFFRPEFTQAVAAVRADVEVALLEEAGQTVGFFPYQRGAGGVGRPVGGRLSDFQAVILRPDFPLNVTELLRGCRLSAWHFDHLLASQTAFEPCHWKADCSPLIDVSAGFDAYAARRRELGPDKLQQTLRQMRKVERTFASVRLEFHTPDREVLSTLIGWKSQQYQRSQIISLFSFPWTMELIDRLAQADTPDFAGRLTALYFDDRLAAAHFGLQSRTAYHWYFPAYDPEFAQLSPGSQLLVRTAQEGARRGLQRVDLGKGPEPYKRQFMSGSIPLAEGSVDLRAVRGRLRRLYHHTHHWVRESPLRAPATVPWRWMRYVRDRIQYR